MTKYLNKRNAKNTVLGITIGVIIVAALWYFTPLIQQAQTPSNAIKVTVGGGQSTTVTIADKPYTFTYIQKGTAGLDKAYFSCTTPDNANAGGIALSSYEANLGSKYEINLYGTPIIVSISSIGTILVLNIIAS